jgi:hypothetical protein
VKDYGPSVGKLDHRALKSIFVDYSGKKRVTNVGALLKKECLLVWM